MDNKTLKAFVIKLKNDGLTFQKISDILSEEHNVTRSRQAIQGMYQRAINYNESDEAKDRIVATADTVNIYCLGYTMDKVKELANQLGHKLSYNDVVVIIRNQKEYIEDVRKSITKRVMCALRGSVDIETIKDSLKYRNIISTDKQLKTYIAEAYKDWIGLETSKLLAKAYQFTDDKAIVKKIIKDLNLKVDMEDIRENL